MVALYAATSGPGRDTHGGMAAFGDCILFLAIFAVASLPVTGAALFFLRPYPAFWRALAALAVVVALTGLVVLADSLATGPSAWGPSGAATVARSDNCARRTGRNCPFR